METDVLYTAKSKYTDEWVVGYYAKLKHWMDDSITHVIIPLDATLYPYCEVSGLEIIDLDTLESYASKFWYEAYAEGVDKVSRMTTDSGDEKGE